MKINNSQNPYPGIKKGAILVVVTKNDHRNRVQNSNRFDNTQKKDRAFLISIAIVEWILLFVNGDMVTGLTIEPNLIHSYVMYMCSLDAPVR